MPLFLAGVGESWIAACGHRASWDQRLVALSSQALYNFCMPRIKKAFKIVTLSEVTCSFPLFFYLNFVIVNLLEPNPPMQLCKTNPRFEKTAPPLRPFRSWFFSSNPGSSCYQQTTPARSNLVRSGFPKFFPICRGVVWRTFGMSEYPGWLVV